MTVRASHHQRPVLRLALAAASVLAVAIGGAGPVAASSGYRSVGADGTAAVAAAGVALSTLSSYRYQVVLAGTLAASAPVKGETIVATGAVGRRGLYVRLSGNGRAITYLESGSSTWLGVAGTGWLRVGRADPRDVGSMTSFLPGAYFNGLDPLWATAPVFVATEQVNGVSADHYRVAPAVLLAAAASRGFSSPSSFALDVWVAHDGGWLVRADFHGFTDGQTGSSYFGQRIEISGVNAPVTLPTPGTSSPR
jgi:hypothetical protein